MNDRFVESREALSYAREALKNGAMAEARQWAERSAELAPQSEDPWLILAAVASPGESLDYIRKALALNPDSPRAKKGMEWALQRLGETPKSKVSPQNENQAEVKPEAQQSKDKEKSAGKKNPKKRSVLLPVLLGLMGFAVLAFAAWSAVTSPALASILSLASAPAQPVERQPFAQVDIAKPSVANTPVALQPVEQAVIPTATALPTATATTKAEVVIVPPTDVPTLEASAIPTNTSVVEAATSTPEATSVPGVLVAEIVADTPTPEFAATAVVADIPLGVGNGGEHWIDVDLSQQRVYAYEGDVVVNSFVVSTGTWQTPTVTGSYKIWIKLRSTTMSGPGYYLTDVPYTMYFYKGYGLHGTYWHNNFGTPMSHGCVNLATPDAEWLYNFSSVGTVVNVHY